MIGITQAEFDKVFHSWYDPVRNFIYYKSGDVQVAEDITQEVFLKIWEKKEEIKIETVKSLLFTIANNMFLNRIEHQKVSFRFVNNFQRNTLAEAPDFELEMKEFDQRLQKALADLDEKKRTVFLMNRIDEFTYNEIAENLGLTVKAVEKRMEKALAFLRKRIEMNI
ncbi:MAG TPA: RNA polymerase sigma-70 factor [Bacteroidales bacterium]